jgi:hypothetical protein
MRGMYQRGSYEQPYPLIGLSPNEREIVHEIGTGVVGNTVSLSVIGFVQLMGAVALGVTLAHSWRDRSR